MATAKIQNWLITGGTGFIGKALTTALIKTGMHVTVLTRNPAAAANHMPEHARLISNLDDIEDDASVDCIVNLAGEPLFGGRWTKKRKQLFFDSRLGTTSACVKLVSRLKQKPHVMISGSAIGYYGMSASETFDENSPTGTDEMAQLCSDWENAAAPVIKQGVRLAMLRTGLVLDKSGGMLKPLMLSSKLGMGAKIGTGQQWMSWISLHDIIRLILFIAENGDINGAINATAPNPVRQVYFSDALANYVKRPRLITIPKAPLSLMLGDMADFIVNGQKVMPIKAINAGFEFEHTDLDQAFA